MTKGTCMYTSNIAYCCMQHEIIFKVQMNCGKKQGSQGSHCCGKSLWYGKTGVNSLALRGDDRIVVRGDGFDAAV
uniref:Uncharacterized protein n=1 Tax=Salix viminalis TaxID=40686 RepID=A0A6N2K0Z6_SALVM